VTDFSPLSRLAVLLVRPGLLIVTAPFFGGAYAPPILKIGLTLVLGVSLMPLVPVPDAVGSASVGIVVMREALIGLALAFGLRVLVAAAEFGGHLAGFQLGFTYASLVDPQNGVRNGVLSALYGTMAIVVFFTINAHHDLLRALVHSYEALPIGAGHVGDGLALIVTHLLGMVFVVGAQMAAPIVIVLLIVEVALGLLSRTAPMLNVLAQGFPIRLLVGLLALAAMVRIVPGVLIDAVPRAIELGLRAAGMFR
jgi:flagellar biosynthetic protein FliR